MFLLLFQTHTQTRDHVLVVFFTPNSMKMICHERCDGLNLIVKWEGNQYSEEEGGQFLNVP